MITLTSFAAWAALATTLSIGVAVGAYAHGGATGIVKERMDAMLDMAEAVKTLTASFKNPARYDADSVRSAAQTIQGHSGANITRLFPEGSHSKMSEALPRIWQEWQTFAALSDDLGTYAAALAASADRGASAQGAGMPMAGGGMMGGNMMGGGMMGGGMMGGGAPKPTQQMLDQMPSQALFTMVTQTCASCHTRFREEKK